MVFSISNAPVSDAETLPFSKDVLRRCLKQEDSGIKQHDLNFPTNAALGYLPQDDLRNVGMREWLGAHQCHVYLGYGFGGKEGSISHFREILRRCSSCFYSSSSCARR